MGPKGGGLARRLVEVWAWLVPSRRRAAWLREWRAELAAARQRAGSGDVRLAMGALADAWTLRRIDGARSRGFGAKTTTWGEGMRGMVKDITRAARGTLRAPGFFGISIVTLGVGLGAAAAIFTVVDAVLLRPLPYPGAARIVTVYHTMTVPGADRGDWPLTRQEYQLFRDQTRAFEAMGAYQTASVVLGGSAPATEVRTAHATASLLEMLGATAAVGRLFDDTDDRPAAAPVTVLSWGLWQRRYGGDAAVVGRTVEVDGVPREVVGVMARDVELPTVRVELWTPLALRATEPATDQFRLSVLARLAPGLDLSAATAEVERLQGLQLEAFPFFSTLVDQFGLRSHARSLRDEVVGGVERALWILLGAVGIVLLVALGNVANLFLVRTESRRREVAVRTALGASGGQLVRLFVAEALVVCLAAGALGLVLAWWGVRTLVALTPPSIPRLDGLSMGGATVGLVLVLALLGALALGLYPRLRLGRGGSDALVSRGTQGAQGSAVRGRLVVAQVALALVLLSGAALMVRTFRSLRSVDLGFRSAGVLAAHVSVPADVYPEEEARVFVEDLLGRLRALPGVASAAVGPTPISDGTRGCTSLYVEGVVLGADELPPCVPQSTSASAEYRSLLSIPLVEGRFLESADAANRLPVAVVSENLAQRLWPGEDPLGKAVRPGPMRPGFGFYRVVGVVGAVRAEGPAADPIEQIYYPMLGAYGEGWAPHSLTLLVRGNVGGEGALAGQVRQTVAALDPDVPVTIEGPVTEVVARSTVRTTFTLLLLGIAAFTALVLGLAGLYGVVSYQVGTRRGELGLRMALGAQASQVRNLVLGHTLRIVALGVALGLAGAWGLGRVMESLLYGVAAGDPATLAAAAGVLVLATLLASWIPARRATRVDPAEALQAE